MTTHSTLKLFALLASGFVWSAVLADDAQEHEHDHDHEHAHTEVVAYRLPAGAKFEFTNPELAEQHLEAVERLQCVASLETAGEVTSVSYYCADWKSVEIATHELALEWMDWLKAAGFDCSHGDTDPALLEGEEVVEFRLTEWQTVHAESEEAPALVETLTRIGCEVQQTDDGGHLDVSFRSPLWKDIHFADHETAEQWIAWLEGHDFEVRHEHDHDHAHDHEHDHADE
jgi:hypothetical protein